MEEVNFSFKKQKFGIKPGEEYKESMHNETE